MRSSTRQDDSGAVKFFRLILSHDDLYNYYKTNFLLMYNHKFALTELEDMMPWERDVYVGLLTSYIEEQNKKRQQNQR